MKSKRLTLLEEMYSDADFVISGGRLDVRLNGHHESAQYLAERRCLGNGCCLQHSSPAFLLLDEAPQVARRYQLLSVSLRD